MIWVGGQVNARQSSPLVTDLCSTSDIKMGLTGRRAVTCDAWWSFRDEEGISLNYELEALAGW